MGVNRGLSWLKGPCAQGIVSAEGHGIHPVAVALQSPAEHTLGEKEIGQIGQMHIPLSTLGKLHLQISPRRLKVRTLIHGDLNQTTLMASSLSSIVKREH